MSVRLSGSWQKKLPFDIRVGDMAKKSYHAQINVVARKCSVRADFCSRDSCLWFETIIYGPEHEQHLANSRIFRKSEVVVHGEYVLVYLQQLPMRG